MSHAIPGRARTPARPCIAVLLTCAAALLVAGPAAAAPVAVPTAATPPGAAATLHAHRVAAVLATAAALRGRPYRYGARGPEAFDCSGFTGWVMRRAGRSLPRTSAEQYAASRPVARADLQPGDLVFFRHGSRIYHVAIYAGHDLIWHARQPGQGVALTPISAQEWWAGRVL